MDRQSKTPTIALVLKILGIGAIVIAPLGVLSFIPSPSEPSQSAAPLIWFAAVLVSGLLLFGFASVIEKLSYIEDHLRRSRPAIPIHVSSTTSPAAYHASEAQS